MEFFSNPARLFRSALLLGTSEYFNFVLPSSKDIPYHCPSTFYYRLKSSRTVIWFFRGSNWKYFLTLSHLYFGPFFLHELICVYQICVYQGTFWIWILLDTWNTYEETLFLVNEQYLNVQLKFLIGKIPNHKKDNSTADQTSCRETATNWLKIVVIWK